MLYDKLYDFQKKIIDNNISKDNLGLFLDMGLGKTPLSLAFAEANSSSKILIITINSKACEDESVSGSFMQWSTCFDDTYNRYYKWSDLSQMTTSSKDIYIINYEALYKRVSSTRGLVLSDNVLKFINSSKQSNVTVILDESHKIKDLQAKQTKAVLKIISSLRQCAKSVKTYLCTGTPFTAGYVDLYVQLKVLGLTMTKTEFVETFCVRDTRPGLLGWQQPIVGYKNVSLLFELIHMFAITMKSEDVLQLPEQIFHDIELPQTDKFKLYSSEKYNSKLLLSELTSRRIDENSYSSYDINIKREKSMNPFFRNLDFPNTRWLADTSGLNWLRARQISIGFQGNSDCYTWYDKSRLEAFRRLISSNTNNYVIFYNYSPELYELYGICRQENYNVDVYCGDIKSLTNYERYESLTSEERLVENNNVILANFASGSTGKNWQLYNRCIIFSTPLYKDYSQAIKRLHRIGQSSSVVYYRMSQCNFLDKAMRSALSKKIQYSAEMFESDLSKYLD